MWIWRDNFVNKMSASCVELVLLVLLCIRGVNVYPVVVCNCNTNITFHTSTNGSVFGLTAGTTSTNQPTNTATDIFKRDAVDICVDADCVTAAARIIKSMDTKIDPCDNFFEFACGKWNRMNVIPDDKSYYNTFSQLREQLAVVIKVLLEEPITDNELVAVKKTKNFYKSCVSDEAITNVGLTPIYKLLDELGGWPVINGSAWNASEFDILSLMAKLRHYNNKILIEQWVSPDDKQSDRHIIQLDQAVLSLPNRDYYTGDLAGAYEQYAIDVAVAIGADPEVAKRDMRDMVNFEIALANITIPENMRRDSVQMYNKMTVRELSRNITGLDWLRYLQLIFRPYGINITEDEEVVVYAMGYFTDLNELLQKVENRTLANYLIWRIMMNRVNNLGKPYRDLKNNFSKMLHGTNQQSSRWRDCVTFINDNMGNVIGRLVVETNFDLYAKKQALSMVKYIRGAFYDLLDQALFMDAPTRVVAKEKAAAIGERIGFPERILNDTSLAEDFEDIDFHPERYFNNILSNIQNLAKHSLKKLRIPVNKEEWSTTPAVVNAFYSTAKNQIYFPAAILQPPFYSKGYPKSLNFGGIGMVIGHEITHGFDDRGRLYDKDGNMRQWWNQAVIDEFKREAQCIIDQYSNFTVPSINMNLNGILTQGENIADNGGLKEAYMGYRKWVEKENGGKEEARLPGLDHLSNDHLFFLNFAQVWCGTQRPESALTAIRIGAHAPGKFRVLGTLQNSHEFAKIYKCPLNSPMNPEKKCRVW